MIRDNQGSPFVLFKKDYNKDCFWILFLRKGLGIRRGVMVIHLEKEFEADLAVQVKSRTCLFK